LPYLLFYQQYINQKDRKFIIEEKNVQKDLLKSKIGVAWNYPLSLGRAHQRTGGYWPQGREIIKIVEEAYR
jgi:hypothetical protein